MRTALALALLSSLTFGDEPEKSVEKRGHVFAWPFVEWEKMVPRGGTTQGAEVTLVTDARATWKKLTESGIDQRERDRRAILAMAGDYRVSFDFVETLGFSPDYEPPRPYFSWGTEHVKVLEDSDNFISLQHALVMYFKNEDGEIEGPAVMKHWRQDWIYEPETILTYAGNSTWEKVPAPAPEGRWSQAVWQVDDSPRYAVMGEWVHEGGLHTWRSDSAMRPLPRREFSVRDDYNVLEGVHDLTIAPTGWLHVQNNRKLRLGEDGSKKYVGTEIGVDRYEAITSPELAGPFADSWEKTAPYWQEVRDQWAAILDERDSFRLRQEVDDKKLWQYHFEQAGEFGELDEDDAPDRSDDAQMIRETLGKFLAPPESSGSEKSY